MKFTMNYFSMNVKDGKDLSDPEMLRLSCDGDDLGKALTWLTLGLQGSTMVKPALIQNSGNYAALPVKTWHLIIQVI